MTLKFLKSMVVFRVVLVRAFANELDQKISVYAFVVMQRHQREII